MSNGEYTSILASIDKSMQNIDTSLERIANTLDVVREAAKAASQEVQTAFKASGPLIEKVMTEAFKRFEQ